MCIACNVKRNEVGKGIKDCILIKLNATDENNAKTKPQKQEIGHSPSGNFLLSFLCEVAVGNGERNSQRVKVAKAAGPYLKGRC